MSPVEFTVIIPAREGSTRFPGKPLADLLGQPMIQHVHQRALESGAARVLVATDSERIAEVARGFGAEVVMTRADHPSGTDRLAEAVEREAMHDPDIVVNLQGDEPLMPPALIRQVAAMLAQRPDADMATLATPIVDRAEVFNPNVVKVVRARQGRALYFSRAPIPWDRDGFATQGAQNGALAAGYLRHLGIYAYRVSFLRRYPGLSEVELERAESLEQLRALWHGARIYVDVADDLPGPGVDTPEDLAKVAAILRARRVS
ncbi:MAG: 3-deoxy-manno-octulosonate cytidylyltransferase [Xanthomonadaceae bacterium]|nr:3-deoxy-manno-octulosonate cytidylyltransferase [Xanthomonadaceae bacterium]